jgi:hypothetical protein
MFTDRKKFMLKHPGVKLSPQTWLRRGQKRQAYTVSKPTCVNVYAGITKFGVTKLHFVAGTSKMKTTHMNKKGQVAKNVTASEYKEVVSQTFLPEGRRIFSNQGFSYWTLQQDNDPTHKQSSLAAVADWNKRHNSAVSILPNWPPNSPDLNLIENVWGIVQRQVDMAGCCNLEEFKATVTSAFQRLDKQVLRGLFASMQRRLKDCIELSGGKTKY